MEYKRTDALIILFFFYSLFIFYLMISPPVEPDHHMFYTLYAFGILISTIGLTSIFCIKLEALKKVHFISALIFGVLSMAITIPLIITGVAMGISTFFIYLASISLSHTSEYRMKMITSFKLRDISIDLLLIATIALSFMLLHINTLITSDVSFQINLIPLLFVALNSLAPAISEEIIFRMFLFALMIKINKGYNVSTITMLIIMIVPFVLIHVIDIAVIYGFWHPNTLGIIISITPVSVVISVLALKRNIFTAIGVHFMYNFIIANISFIL